MKYLVIGCVSLAVLGIGWVYVLRHDSAIGAGADSPTATTGYSKDQTFTERLETFSQKVKDSGPDAGNDGGGVEIVKWETIVVDIEPCERAINRPDYCDNPVLHPEKSASPIIVGKRTPPASRRATKSDKDGTSIVACKRAVEDLAKWDYDWTGGWLQDRFPVVEISGEHLILAGNSIKMQNGFGAWRRVAYVCMYNVVTKFAVAVAED